MSKFKGNFQFLSFLRVSIGGVELMIIILAFLRLRLTDKISPLLRLTPNFFDRLTAKGYFP